MLCLLWLDAFVRKARIAPAFDELDSTGASFTERQYKEFCVCV